MGTDSDLNTDAVMARQSIGRTLNRTVSEAQKTIGMGNPWLIDLTSTREKIEGLPSEVFMFYHRYIDAAREVMAEKGWNVPVVTRVDLYKQWVMKMGWQHSIKMFPAKDEKQERYARNPSGTYDLWQGFAYKAFVRLNLGREREDESGAIGFTRQPFERQVQSLFGAKRRTQFEFIKQNVEEQIRSGNWPFEEIESKLYFKDPHLFFALVADGILDANNFLVGTGEINLHISTDKVLKSLDETHALNLENLARNELLFSMIAERLFIKEFSEAKFADFLVSLAKRVGGKEGFLLSERLLEGINSEYLKTCMASSKGIIGSKLSGEEITERVAFARGKLQEAKRAYFYPQREMVLEPEFLETAVARLEETSSLDAFRVKVWKASGANVAMEAIRKREPGTDLIYQVAEGQRKQFATDAAAVGQMLGLSKEETVELMAQVQMYWGWARLLDYVLDKQFENRGKPTPLALYGEKVTLYQSFEGMLTLLRASYKKDGKVDTGRLESVLTMQIKALQGDMQNNRSGLEATIKDHKSADAKMNDVFAWGAEEAGRMTGLTEPAALLGVHLICKYGLGKMVNDCQDVAGEKNPAGSDVQGRVVTWVWMAIRNSGTLTSEEEQLFDKFFTKDSDPAHPKEVASDEKARILAIGKEKLPIAVAYLRNTIQEMYAQGSMMLEEACKKLPKMDRTNELYRVYLEKSLAEMYTDLVRRMGETQFTPQVSQGDIYGQPEEAPIPIDTATLSSKTPVPVGV